jgi:hypothetical protein
MVKGKLFILTELSFYFDENVEIAVSEQLEKAGFDVVSVLSLNARGDDDLNHLQKAAEMGRVLCTYDSDFLALASEGVEHAGIAFAQSEKTSIGDWVRELRFLHANISAEQAKGQIFFVKTNRE